MPKQYRDGQDVRRYWLLNPEMRFLNHGSFGACPTQVLDAQQAWRNRMETQPVNFMARELPHLIRHAASRLATFLGAEAEDLAFVENATAGINAVMRSYPWQAGDEIVLSSYAYPAIKNTVKFVAQQFNLCVKEFTFTFPLINSEEISSAFEACLTPNTRMAVLDHISSPLSIIYPIDAMLEICRDRGIKTLVDGAHAPGMISLNISKLDADWYVGNCHKWLFAPKGCAFIVTKKINQPCLQPTVVSLRMNEGYPYNFDWVGTRDASAWLAIEAALDFYEAMGHHDIPHHLHQFAIEMGQLFAGKWHVEISAPANMLGAMITLPLPFEREFSQEEADALRDKLWQTHQIEVPLFVLNKGQIWCRTSAQLYNTASDFECFADAVLMLKSRQI